MRLFASMGTYMDRQSAALNETLVAVAPGANVGSVIGVYAIMSDEVGLAIELLHGEANRSAHRYMAASSSHARNNYLWT